MPRTDDMDPTIAELARITCEEISDEDLLDYFGYTEPSVDGPKPILVYETDTDIPF